MLAKLCKVWVCLILLALLSCDFKAGDKIRMARIPERMSVVITITYHLPPCHHQSSRRTQFFPYTNAEEILNKYWFEEELSVKNCAFLYSANEGYNPDHN